ncbi:MAG: hypothetical protein Q9201_002259 [Fulgogasparrea decipioides]
MPTFYARSLNIRLSVADIAKTVTPNPATTLSTEGVAKADRVLEQFEAATEHGTLAETPLWGDHDGCRLGFLGERQEPPFLMVHAKPDYPFRTMHATKRKKPPPLRLTTHNGDSQDSSLTDLPSSPLSPLPTPDSTGSQVGQTSRDEPNETGASIHPFDGAGEDEEGLASTGSQQENQESTASQLAAAEPVQNFEHGDRPHISGPHDQDKLLEQPFSPPEPQALCLRVLPGKRSFLALDPNLDGSNQNDLKVDVFLNGDLCTSAYFSEKPRNVKDHGRHIYSGARTGRLVEKPWILMPPATDTSRGADPLVPRTQSVEGARSRWAKIAHALMSAAETTGRNSRDELPGIGQYLQSLASLPVPAALPALVTTGQFAVIDVVVSTGKGRKDDVSGIYLARPMPLKLHGFGMRIDTALNTSREPPTKQQTATDDRFALSVEPQADEQIARQSFSSYKGRRGSSGRFIRKTPGNEVSTEPTGGPNMHRLFGKLSLTEQSKATSRVSSGTQGTYQSHVPDPANPSRKGPMSVPGESADPATSKSGQGSSRSPPILRKRRSRTKSLTITIPEHYSTSSPLTKSSNDRSKRPRIQYHDVLTTQQTLDEEIEDIVREAKEQAKRQIANFNPADPAPDVDAPAISASAYAMMGNGMEAPQSNKPSKVVKIRMSLQKQRSNRNSSGKPDTTLTAATPSLNYSQANNSIFSDLSSTPLPDPTGEAVPSPAYMPPQSPQRQHDEIVMPPVSASVDSSPEKPLIQRYLSATPQTGSTTQNSRAAAVNTPISPSSNTIQPSQTVPNETPSSVRSSMKKGMPSNATPNRPVPWTVPELSKNSIVTYAEGETVRQTKAVKAGRFMEDGLVLGVRFVVG